MNADLVALLYLVAGGALHPGAARAFEPGDQPAGQPVRHVGMAIAIVTTLASHPPAGLGAWALVIGGMAIGGGAGAVIARRVPMTAMPELVAAFHSLVGMAAVLVAAGALYAPAAFDIGTVGAIHKPNLVEMSLGVAIGAITFTGSVIAFLKLSGRMSGAPIHPARATPDQYRAGARHRRAGRLVRARRKLSGLLAPGARLVPVRRADHRADRRRRHAGRDLHAQFLFRLGGGRHRLHAGQFRSDHHRRAGRLLRRDPLSPTSCARG